MKKKYIIPALYVRQFVVSNLVLGTPTTTDEGATDSGQKVEGEDYGNGGNSLAKEYAWGDCWTPIE